MKIKRKKKCGSSTYTEKTHLKSKAIIRDKEEHCIMIKGTIQQENITLINIFASNTRAPKYVKQILMDIKGEIDRNAVIVGDFNTPLTSMDRLPGRKSTRREQP